MSPLLYGVVMAMLIAVCGGLYFSYLSHNNPGHLMEYTVAGILLGVAAVTLEKLLEKKKS